MAAASALAPARFAPLLGDRIGFSLQVTKAPERIIVDPGIGFAKRAEQSFAVIAGLSGLNALGLPILNDGIYPALTPENTADFSKPLQLLAQVLEFIDPVTSLPQKFVSQRRLEGASADQVKWAQQTTEAHVETDA